ncbi:hypothetical protein ACFL6S_28880 [Candidatus Poribacteria bacterium]
MLSKITRTINVTVVCCVVFMLAFMAISVNCEVESTEDLWTGSMFIKPDRIILNANSEVNYVTAQFSRVFKRPSEVEASLTLTNSVSYQFGSNLYHYCDLDNVLQVHFVRQEFKTCEAGDYTATVPVEITFDDGSTLGLTGYDKTVELVRQGGGSGK